MKSGPVYKFVSSGKVRLLLNTEAVTPDTRLPLLALVLRASAGHSGGEEGPPHLSILLLILPSELICAFTHVMAKD